MLRAWGSVAEVRHRTKSGFSDLDILFQRLLWAETGLALLGGNGEQRTFPPNGGQAIVQGQLVAQVRDRSGSEVRAAIAPFPGPARPHNPLCARRRCTVTTM